MSPSVLLERLLIPESTRMLLDDSTDDVIVGGACIQRLAGTGTAAESCCEFKIKKLLLSSKRFKILTGEFVFL